MKKLSLNQAKELFLNDTTIIGFTLHAPTMTLTVERYEQADVDYTIAKRTFDWIQGAGEGICHVNMVNALVKEGAEKEAAIHAVLADGTKLRYQIRCFHEEMACIEADKHIQQQAAQHEAQYAEMTERYHNDVAGVEHHAGCLLVRAEQTREGYAEMVEGIETLAEVVGLRPQDTARIIRDISVSFADGVRRDAEEENHRHKLARLEAGYAVSTFDWQWSLDVRHGYTFDYERKQTLYRDVMKAHATDELKAHYIKRALAGRMA